MLVHVMWLDVWDLVLGLLGLGWWVFWCIVCLGVGFLAGLIPCGVAWYVPVGFCCLWVFDACLGGRFGEFDFLLGGLGCFWCIAWLGCGLPGWFEFCGLL